MKKLAFDEIRKNESMVLPKEVLIHLKGGDGDDSSGSSQTGSNGADEHDR